MKNIVEKLKQYLDFKGVLVSIAEKEIGLSNGALSKPFNAGTTIKTDSLEKFLKKYSDLNPTWLLSDIGEMLKSEDFNSNAESKSIYEVKKKGIPLLPFEAFAGVGESSVTGVDFEMIEDRYDVPLFYNIQVDFMINVRGSSMYPKYSSGDVVACRMVDDLLFVQWNKIYVIDTISQGVIMKRLKKSTIAGRVVCKSDNSEYDEFEVPMSDIRNIALVVGSIRLE